MQYRGSNPVGLALARDTDGSVRDEILRVLAQYQADAHAGLQSASVPAVHRRHLAAAQCAAACAAVVKEFHALCAGTVAGHTGQDT